ncbi:MAG TPA: CCA tRNA nucleotidyltransferase [Acidimicrobiales bacterium]|nr:CCA tRNA nucleotidyltransferase [Acidimicrobiales bacterium]
MVPERLQALRSLIDETAELSARFADAGHQLYLVGGVVRDALLDRLGSHADLDFTTDALPDQIEALVSEPGPDGSRLASAVWTQGKRFGTIGCIIGDHTIEITTHRAEAYRPDSRKPEVVFADAVEADLSRRDFTVNAMALSLPDLQLIDPFGGAADLHAGRLRTPLSPEESFSDDPLRMMRAARFIAGYSLVPEQQLVDAVVTMRARLDIVSDERVRDELDKLMVVPKPGEGLWFLVRTGLAEEFLPELPALAVEQDPIHRHKDVLAHTIAVVENTWGSDPDRPDRLLRLAALFHDVGKPKTRSFGPRGLVTFHHHEVVGARMTRDRMRALRYSAEDTETVTRLVELHLRFHTYRMGWTDSAVRRYVRDAGPLLGQLNELTRCDCTTRNAAKARALARRMDELEARIAELQEQEELRSIRPDLDGNAVMARLGLRPGREVGEALAFLLELRLEEGPLGEEEAGRRLDAWWAARAEQRP